MGSLLGPSTTHGDHEPDAVALVEAGIMPAGEGGILPPGWKPGLTGSQGWLPPLLGSWPHCMSDRLLPLLALALLAFIPFATGAELIQNGGFEQEAAGWSTFWTRESKAGELAIDRSTVHSGKAAVRITHRGSQDWSFNSASRLPVKAGELFDFDAWLKLDGNHTATLCVVTYDQAGKAIQWSFGGREVQGPSDWRQVRSRFIVPPNVAEIHPRLIGQGAGTTWVDDVSLHRTGNLADLRGGDLPAQLTISNATLAVTLHTGDATLSVLDRRTKQTWRQKAPGQDVIVKKAQGGKSLRLELLHLPSGLDLGVTIELDGNQPEFTLSLAAQGELAGALKYPHPFVTDAGTYLVVPMNEGISYPVEDQSIRPLHLIAYGGHGICMAFWGVTDGARGQMAILETPDDASIRIDRADGRLFVAPEWDSQRKQFGYARKLRYAFFDRGGHMAIAKRYRAHAQKIGLLKPLAQKRQENPNVDLLIGAVNVWCWDKEAVNIVKEMQAVGIQRILWSNRQSPENLKTLNDLGVLTSRYDIYQDTMNPENFKFLRGVHSDWTTDAWPQDIILKANGDWLRGWGVKGKQDDWYYCGVICDKRAPDYARKRIPAELATHPYRSRFIDTTTAAPWHECYDKNHPMTRTESKQAKMELLRYVSADSKLVTGCETGHDASVPFLHYYEGMLSLGPYRVRDAGRNMQEILTEVPEQIAKFQVGQRYRLPLWELVYHDCVVAQWYWGDYNNKLPAVWDKRDLFNALYGTPPMFMFNRKVWQENRDRFAQSYKNVCGVARAVGYAEMTDHRFLTSDRDVQQTKFANGVTVTVNFGSTPYRLADGGEVAPLGISVAGLKQ